MALGFAARTAVADADYTFLPGDTMITYTSLTAARTVTLPSATKNREQISIKDETGLASNTLTISVKAAAGQSVDGVANPTTTVVINSAYGAAAFYSNGTNWFQLY